MEEGRVHATARQKPSLEECGICPEKKVPEPTVALSIQSWGLFMTPFLLLGPPPLQICTVDGGRHSQNLVTLRKITPVGSWAVSSFHTVTRLCRHPF